MRRRRSKRAERLRARKQARLEQAEREHQDRAQDPSPKRAPRVGGNGTPSPAVPPARMNGNKSEPLDLVVDDIYICPECGEEIALWERAVHEAGPDDRRLACPRQDLAALADRDRPWYQSHAFARW
jgi:hypothetical protein